MKRSTGPRTRLPSRTAGGSGRRGAAKAQWSAAGDGPGRLGRVGQALGPAFDPAAEGRFLDGRQRLFRLGRHLIPETWSQRVLSSGWPATTIGPPGPPGPSPAGC